MVLMGPSGFLAHSGKSLIVDTVLMQDFSYGFRFSVILSLTTVPCIFVSMIIPTLYNL